MKDSFANLLQNERLEPKKVGVRSASTFPGFCNLHDATMFRPAEHGSVQLAEENCFLLSFRAIAFELLSKQRALAMVPLQRELDKGRPFATQARLQQELDYFEAGHKMGLDDMVRWKADYDHAYLNRDFSKYRYYAAAFDGVLPVVACGAFHPEFDFEGRALQKLGVGAAGHEHVTFNLTIFDGRSVAVLGWTADGQGPAAAFARSFARAIQSAEGDPAVRLALEHLENTYLKPGWWDALSGPAKTGVIAHLLSGGIRYERKPTCLSPQAPPFVSGFCVAETLEKI
jgi:hypothetical protein